ncbi:MAG: indolepyruvate ferredoxin oxidoreductase subunit alpha [Candidatus Cryosericum sp.]
MSDILTAESGSKLYLLGNEAVVRGALENGISVAATYPGTPSSEIGDTFMDVAKDAGMYFEFSTNEKVALEVAAAAAASGLRSFVWMKHVGLNVASDSFMSIAHTKIRAGMVVLSADDPSMWSSQNEQDNRWYARLGNTPVLEPSSPQEMHDLMKYAYEISEKSELPVLMRTTTRISHMRGIVSMGEVHVGKKMGEFLKEPSRFLVMPAQSYPAHKRIIATLAELAKDADASPWNKVYKRGGKLGIITSGPTFNYAMDVVDEYDLKADVLKLTFTYPFPEQTVLSFLKDHEAILVAEEVDPIMEKEVYAILGKYGLQRKIYGKLDGTMPMPYEFSPDILKAGISKALGLTLPEKTGATSDLKLPVRPPVWCPGCPHRAMYYATKKAIEHLGISNAVFPADIGCYSLSAGSPYTMADYLLSMGSSIGLASGLSVATDQKVIAFIGDSTFFHSGMPPLVNVVHAARKLVIVVLDNRITAMTGGQPNPGMPLNGMGEVAPEVSIEEIVKAMGVGFVKTVDPANLAAAQAVMEEALQFDGVAVVISKHPCVMIKTKDKSTRQKLIFTVDKEKCDKCMLCVTKFACPAMFIDKDGKVAIDAEQCNGCAVCVQVCPQKAIGVRR